MGKEEQLTSKRVGVARYVTAIALILLGATVVAEAAHAESPHFVHASASGPNAQGNLIVDFKIAGLADNQGLTVTASADASATYACKNRGGNFPQDPKKEEVSGPVSKSGSFTSAKNGEITGRLPLSPPGSTSALACRDDQRPVLAKVSYTSVQVSGGGDMEQIPGTFEVVLEPKCRCL